MTSLGRSSMRLWIHGLHHQFMDATIRVTTPQPYQRFGYVQPWGPRSFRQQPLMVWWQLWLSWRLHSSLRVSVSFQLHNPRLYLQWMLATVTWSVGHQEEMWERSSIISHPKPALEISPMSVLQTLGPRLTRHFIGYLSEWSSYALAWVSTSQVPSPEPGSLEISLGQDMSALNFPDLAFHLGEVAFLSSPCMALQFFLKGSPWSIRRKRGVGHIRLMANPLMPHSLSLKVKGPHFLFSSARAGPFSLDPGIKPSAFTSSERVPKATEGTTKNQLLSFVRSFSGQRGRWAWSCIQLSFMNGLLDGLLLPWHGRACILNKVKL